MRGIQKQGELARMESAFSRLRIQPLQSMLVEQWSYYVGYDGFTQRLELAVSVDLPSKSSVG